MKIELKMQIDALKQLAKTNVKTPRYFDNGEGWIYFSLDGYTAVRIHKSDFWLDREKLRIGEGLRSVFENFSALEESELALTDEIRALVKGTGNILKCKDFETCINSDFLKPFSKSGYKMYAKNEKSVIHFVLGDTIFAAVMPIYLGTRK